MLKKSVLPGMFIVLLWACGSGGSEPPAANEQAPSGAVNTEEMKAQPAPEATPQAAAAGEPSAEGTANAKGPEIAPTSPEIAPTSPEIAPTSPEIAPTGPENPPTVADVLKLKFEGGKRKAVTFPHKLHVELEKKQGEQACYHCHHKAKELGAFKRCTSAGCHGMNVEKKLRVDFAFHKLCRRCHKKILSEQPENEKLLKVKSCNGCHAG